MLQSPITNSLLTQDLSPSSCHTTGTAFRTGNGPRWELLRWHSVRKWARPPVPCPFQVSGAPKLLPDGCVFEWGDPHIGRRVSFFQGSSCEVSLHQTPPPKSRPRVKTDGSTSAVTGYEPFSPYMLGCAMTCSLGIGPNIYGPYCSLVLRSFNVSGRFGPRITWPVWFATVQVAIAWNCVMVLCTLISLYGVYRTAGSAGRGFPPRGPGGIISGTLSCDHLLAWLASA